ncbi:phytoene desaturase family protein [Nocardia fluminea]|uniref:phytoene desaturase family protein n=1 Tax=Nocardia fluminea TaxID=134984 RepID=UPI00343CF511
MTSTSEANPAQYDSIVVGSGLGGLSAAAYLAAAGKRVLVLEQYSALGGSSHVFRRQGRWEFDCGVHYLGECGPDGIVTTIMRGLALDDRLNWLPMDQDGFDRIIGPGFEFAVPVGWDAYLASLLDAFPTERAAVYRYHSVVRRLGESAGRSSVSSHAAMGRALARSGRAALFAAMPFAAFLTICGFSPRSILALSVQCGALASTPLGLPTAAMAGFLQDYVGSGSFYPQGGGQMLAAGFAEVITSHGGAIRTNARVRSITVADRQVTGVRLADGETIAAPAVVSDADIIKTFTELVGLEHLPIAHRARIKSWTMSRPLINGFFGIEFDTATAPNSNYFAIPTWDDAKSLLSLTRMSRQLIDGSGFSTGTDWARQMAARQPMFVQSSSRRDPGNRRAAPAGRSTVEVQTITPYKPELWGFDGYDLATGEYRTSPAYHEVKKIVLEGMAERMEQAFPGSSATVEIAELGSPATQTRFVGNTGGAPFGLKVSVDQFGSTRPGSSTAIGGLFLAGTSTRWGPGTVGAMLSGVHAAAGVTGRDLVTEIRSGAVIADPSALSPWPADFDPLATTRGIDPQADRGRRR